MIDATPRARQLYRQLTGQNALKFRCWRADVGPRSGAPIPRRPVQTMTNDDHTTWRHSIDEINDIINSLID
eukprot:5019616-Pleurochrysis_carterae.AAC.6